MSENLDLVRSIYADWERGDFSRTEWANPEIEFVSADGLQPGRWMGVISMLERWREGETVWEDSRVEADDYRELDDERVLVLVRRRGRGKTSGLELGLLQTRGAGLFHIRDGRVTRYVTYFDRDHAFADLGLAPESGGS
jgi:ketosteroid isomerase-like protein